MKKIISCLLVLGVMSTLILTTGITTLATTYDAKVADPYIQDITNSGGCNKFEVILSASIGTDGNYLDPPFGETLDGGGSIPLLTATEISDIRNNIYFDGKSFTDWMAEFPAYGDGVADPYKSTKLFGISTLGGGTMIQFTSYLFDVLGTDSQVPADPSHYGERYLSANEANRHTLEFKDGLRLKGKSIQPLKALYKPDNAVGYKWMVVDQIPAGYLTSSTPEDISINSVGDFSTSGENTIFAIKTSAPLYYLNINSYDTESSKLAASRVVSDDLSNYAYFNAAGSTARTKILIDGELVGDSLDADTTSLVIQYNADDNTKMEFVSKLDPLKRHTLETNTGLVAGNGANVVSSKWTYNPNSTTKWTSVTTIPADYLLGTDEVSTVSSSTVSSSTVSSSSAPADNVNTSDSFPAILILSLAVLTAAAISYNRKAHGFN